MKLRVYVDNSVVGGCDDEEFRDHSKCLMACFARGDFILVLSSLTLQELAAAPDRVRLHLAAVPQEHIEAHPLTAAAGELAQAYIDRLSAEIDGMTFEEELDWLASHPLTDPFLKRLQDKTAQPPLAPDGGRNRA